MRTWFSPFPVVTRGTDEAIAALNTIDEEINYLRTLSEDLRQRRHEAWNKQPSPVSYSNYLNVVQDHRKAETELTRLLNERLKLVLLADCAFDAHERGDHFPHPSVEAHADEFVQTQKERLIAVSTVAFFGAGISFTTIIGATRGSIGLMSLSWAAFTLSFVICVFAQWIYPVKPTFSIVVYPGRRSFRFHTVFIAGSASFVGFVLMAVTLVMLRVGTPVDARLETRIANVGGLISLVFVVVGFAYGCLSLWYTSVEKGRIRIHRNSRLEL